MIFMPKKNSAHEDIRKKLLKMGKSKQDADRLADKYAEFSEMRKRFPAVNSIEAYNMIKNIRASESKWLKSARERLESDYITGACLRILNEYKTNDSRIQKQLIDLLVHDHVGTKKNYINDSFITIQKIFELGDSIGVKWQMMEKFQEDYY